MGTTTKTINKVNWAQLCHSITKIQREASRRCSFSILCYSFISPYHVHPTQIHPSRHPLAFPSKSPHRIAHAPSSSSSLSHQISLSQHAHAHATSICHHPIHPLSSPLPLPHPHPHLHHPPPPPHPPSCSRPSPSRTARQQRRRPGRRR